MKFVPDDGATSPLDEWMSRVSPFLLADDPHQRCLARADELGTLDVNLVCTCVHAPCTGECCT